MHKYSLTPPSILIPSQKLIFKLPPGFKAMKDDEWLHLKVLAWKLAQNIWCEL